MFHCEYDDDVWDLGVFGIGFGMAWRQDTPLAN